MIGDVLTASVLFEVLREAFPDAQMDYLINENTAPVVLHNPYIDNLLLFNKRPKNKFVYLRQFGKEIQKQQYDIVIDAYSKISSNILTYLSKATQRISFRKWYSNFLYTQTYERKQNAQSHAAIAIEDRLGLIEEILEKKPPIVAPKIYLNESEIDQAKAFLLQHQVALDKPLIMVSILGSNRAKTYPSAYMAQVLDWIPQIVPNAQILFNYIPSQIEDVKAIYEQCSPKTQQHIRLEVYGESLRMFMAISSICTCVIGNEGGAINIGKALGKKTFAIFSPWIKKEAWNLFDDGFHNDSVHLEDFFPEYFNKTAYKDLKPQADMLYQKFEPQLFKDQFVRFLANLKQER